MQARNFLIYIIELFYLLYI